MKKVVFPLFLGVLILASCEKDPDFSKLDEDFIVLTKYDNTYNFKNNAKTYYISDTITLISSDATNPKWSNDLSAQIIDEIKDNFAKMGYTYMSYDQIQDPVTDKYVPQYYVSVTAVKDMQTVIYTYDPYWYWDYYPYYWWWGGYYPYYPYYPYMSGYTYDIGTTLIEMIDMQTSPNASSSTGGHPIRWNAVLGGMLNTGDDMLYEQEAIDQAFTQSSSYLKVN